MFLTTFLIISIDVSQILSEYYHFIWRDMPNQCPSYLNVLISANNARLETKSSLGGMMFNMP